MTRWARVLLALGVGMAGPGLSSLSGRDAAPRRILVTLRPDLAAEVEAGLVGPSAVLEASHASAPRSRAFVARHDVERLRPLFPELVRKTRATGRSERSLAEDVRTKFPARAARHPGLFAPPDRARTYVVEVAAGADVGAHLAALAADPDVERAETVQRYAAQLTPNDPYFRSRGSWGQPYRDLYGLQKLHAAAAWNQSTGAGVVVAVVDTGLDYDHADISSNVWTNAGEIAGNGVDDDGNGEIDDVRGWDFTGSSAEFPAPDNDPRDVFGHGTHVAGTIAAGGDNGIGVVGVAWQAKIMAVRALDDFGFGPTDALAQAIVYAADNGADVINLSWGGGDYSQAIADAVSYAHGLGAVIVAAAGNDAQDARDFFPASLPEVITVAASDPQDQLAYFSNFGPRIDVAAPGVDILSLRAAGSSAGYVQGKRYLRASGTSMAAPQVSGLAALVLAQHPAYTTEQVRQVLRVSAADTGDAGWDARMGYGRVNAAGAMAVVDPLSARLQPLDLAELTEPVDVSGTAAGAAFQRYTLEYGPGPAPTVWTVFAESTVPQPGGVLGTFDPRVVPDGAYTIRLTAFNMSGQSFEDRWQTAVKFVALSNPVPPYVPSVAQVFKPGASVAIEGRAEGPTFAGYLLDWAPGMNATTGFRTDGITLQNGGGAPVASGPLGTWQTNPSTPAGYYTIRLAVQDAGYASEARTTIYLEPDLLGAGWPQRLDFPVFDSSGLMPARNATGAISLDWTDGWGQGLLTFSPDGLASSDTGLVWGTRFPPAVGDLDGQPGDEVVVADSDRLRIFRPDGSESVIQPTVGGSAVDFRSSLVVLDDLDGDGHLEILTIGHALETAADPAATYLFAWTADGQLFRPAFPIVMHDMQDRAFSLNQLIVADFDHSGQKKIVAAQAPSEDSVILRMYTIDGAPVPSFAPPGLGEHLDALAAGDLFGDGRMEIVAMAGPWGTLHVLNAKGAERPGWPQTLGGYGLGFLALGDLRGDGSLQIVAASPYRLSVLKGDGRLLHTRSTTFASPTVLTDVDGDGKLEILTVEERLVPVPDRAPAHVRPAHARPVAGPHPPARYLSAPPRAERDLYDAPELHVLGRDLTVTRSWTLNGMNGEEPVGEGQLTLGDFNGDGGLDVALAYPTIWPSGSSGWELSGVATALTTHTPYAPSRTSWPMAFYNARHTAVVPPR